MSVWRLASAHSHTDNLGPPGSDNGDTPGGVAGAQKCATYVMIESCGFVSPRVGQTYQTRNRSLSGEKSAFTFRDIGFTIRVEGCARLSADFGVAVPGIRGSYTLVLGNTERTSSHAHCADRPIDRSRPPETVWRYRKGHLLAHRGVGGARARRHAVRERRLAHLGDARSRMAPGAAARRRRARRQCVASRHAGARAEAGARLRLPAFPSGLLSVFAVLASGDAVSRDLARAPRPAGAASDLQRLPVGARGFDLERAAATAAAGALGAHGLSWAARHAAGSDGGAPLLPGVSRPHRAREGGRSGDPDRAGMRNSAQDRRPGRSRGSRLLRDEDPSDDRRARRRVYRRDRRP